MKNASDNVKNAFINSFTKLTEWKEKGYFRENFEGVSNSDVINLFGEGKTAMLLDGDWDQGLIEMTGINAGAFVFPGMEEGTPYVINATDGAWALNKELDPAGMELAQ